MKMNGKKSKIMGCNSFRRMGISSGKLNKELLEEVDFFRYLEIEVAANSRIKTEESHSIETES